MDARSTGHKSLISGRSGCLCDRGFVVCDFLEHVHRGTPNPSRTFSCLCGDSHLMEKHYTALDGDWQTLRPTHPQDSGVSGTCACNCQFPLGLYTKYHSQKSRPPNPRSSSRCPPSPPILIARLSEFAFSLAASRGPTTQDAAPEALCSESW